MAQDVVHDVLFAESDGELADVAGERLSAALGAGEQAIVIATPAHREVFAERVRANGMDAAALQEDGTLLLLDAAATLELLRPRGPFDRRAFDRVIGTLVRERVARGPVFAFGEMVALLFDAGSPQEAIELEDAWDELLQATSAGLLCAYPTSLLDDPGHAVHVGPVCGMHSGVVTDSGFRRSWLLPEDATASSQARRLVANGLRARGVSESAFYDTLSVVTELVVNATVHGRPPVSLEVVIDEAVVTVRVGDTDPAVPVVPAAGDAGESGVARSAAGGGPGRPVGRRDARRRDRRRRRGRRGRPEGGLGRAGPLRPRGRRGREGSERAVRHARTAHSTHAHRERREQGVRGVRRALVPCPRRRRGTGRHRIR